MKSLGQLLVLGGIMGAFYFFTAFDTSVSVPTTSYMGQSIGGGRVNNIGLMADRQNGILISVGAAILGMLMTGLSPKREREAKCPWCAKLIPADSKGCRYCGKPVHWESK